MQRLIVKHLGSLHCEEFHEDAHHMRIHTVVKNQPFNLTLAMMSPHDVVTTSPAASSTLVMRSGRRGAAAAAAASSAAASSSSLSIKSEEVLYTFANTTLDIKLVYDSRDGRHDRE
ncbi:MAG: hypothetical protein J0H57_12685, partial [Rhodospirillales bacterium]|nr:hypothetical protein [Rhodospirillales bacterium]